MRTDSNHYRSTNAAGARTRAAFALYPETLILLASAFVVGADNLAFWRRLLALSGDDLFVRAPFLGAAVATTVFGLATLLGLLTPRPALKPVLAFVLIASATAAHFMDNYGVVLDRGMLRNALETNLNEAAELITPELLVRVAVLGVIPAIAVARVNVRRRALLRAVAARTGAVGFALTVFAGSVGAFYGDFVIANRQHRELRHLLTPVNLVSATLAEVRRAHRATRRAPRTVGADARLAPTRTEEQRPALVILVVGETARAGNFSLEGYARQTTPELAARDVVSFGEVYSCGTSTAASLPCMFSHLDADARDDTASDYENLLDVLQRSGVAILWLENNTGCKGVCARVPAERPTMSRVAGRCTRGECFDEVLLESLQDRIDALDASALLVLHQMGSHGPAYHRRYPQAFERFTPACRSNDVRDCTREELVNAYDNTIAYTDHFLAATIDLLARNSLRFDTALVYVSDHGESLGEHGIYLHGLPRFLAPREQTHVPFVVWLSAGMYQRTGIRRDCLTDAHGRPLSHDYLFSSILGLMDVATSVYRPGLDVFASCRRVAAGVAATAGR